MILLGVLTASCTGGATPGSTTTGASVAAPTTDAPVPPPSAVLRYGYAPGDHLVYSVDVNQEISFNADGDGSEMGTDLPIDASLVADASARLMYRFGTAVMPDSITVSITGTFPEPSVTGTVNDQQVDGTGDGSIATELTAIEPIDTDYVIDLSGAIVEASDNQPKVAGAELATLTGISNGLLSRPIGPAFPARAVQVGDSWQTSTPGAGPGGAAADSTSKAVGVVGDQWEILTTTVTEPHDIDLSEQFRQLYLAGIATDTEPTEQVRKALDEIDFTIRVSRSTSTSTIDFDAAAGIPTSASQTATLDLTMVFRYPDTATGTIRGIDLTLTITQSATFDLQP